MHDEPQISNPGDWGDATIATDNQGKTVYSCRYCGFRKYLKTTILFHVSSCKKINRAENENISYVVCKICNQHSNKIGGHIKKYHKLSKKEYIKKYNSPIICEDSVKKYSEASIRNGSWIKKAQKDGVDLTEYWKKVSKGVSKSIMENDDERERRSKLITNLNYTTFTDPKFRKIMSDTAKKTSARPDIIKKRTLQLQNWRDGYAEDFYNKCTFKMIGAFKSKPEEVLFKFLKGIPNFNFRHNQFIHSETFITKTKRKQIDIADKRSNIYVEYDGQVHFHKLYQLENDFTKTKLKDTLLDQYILDNNFILIRVSYDQFISKQNIDNCYFEKECLEKILEILDHRIPGIYKIGQMYDNTLN